MAVIDAEMISSTLLLVWRAGCHGALAKSHDGELGTVTLIHLHRSDYSHHAKQRQDQPDELDQDIQYVANDPNLVEIVSI